MRVLERIWWDYPFVVDFLLYFFFFGALVRAALTRHFGDAAAKRIAVSLGLCLAAGLTVAKDSIGFALEDLGPAAVTLIILVLGIVAYRLLRFAEVPVMYSAMFGLLFGVVSFRALELDFLPNGFHLPPELVLFAWIMGALAVWHGISRSSRGSNTESSRPPDKKRRRAGVPSKKDLVGQRASVTREVSGQKLGVVSKGKSIGRVLDSIREAVSNGRGRLSANKIRNMLSRVEEESAEMAVNLERVRRFDKALREADWAWLNEGSKVNIGELTLQERRALKESIAMERARLGIEARIEVLARDVEAHTLKVRDLLRRAEKDIRAGQDNNVKRWIGEARAEQVRANTLSKEILVEERRLEWLFKKQVHFLR